MHVGSNYSSMVIDRIEGRSKGITLHIHYFNVAIATCIREI